MFWGLVVLMWIAMQVPVIGNPVAFLGTWVHELGHGLGALATGGQFLKLIVSPDFSGAAHTTISSDGAHVIVIISGLLAPSFVGAILLILARGLGLERLVLGLLTFGLVLSGILWAGDMFTRLTVLGAGAILGLIALRTPAAIRSVAAQILAISICLNAFAQIDYFFMRGGHSGGRAVVSDTAVLSDIIGMPHVMWAVALTIFSIGILYLAVRFSGKLAGRRRLKSSKVKR